MFDRVKDVCKGAIDHRGRQLSVDCSGCAGPRSLTQRACFMGLCGRITPGFTGEIMLRSDSDSRYKGAIVEALSASSEVRDMISAIGGKDASRRTRALRERAMASFIEDPCQFPGAEVGLLLEKVGPNERDRVSGELEAIAERTRRMLVRLEA